MAFIPNDQFISDVVEVNDAMMADLLDMEYINSLPQPFIAVFYGGGRWPVHDIEVQTGLLRIDVVGLLDVVRIDDVKYFVDACGKEHDPDDFFIDAAKGVG